MAENKVKRSASQPVLQKPKSQALSKIRKAGKNSEQKSKTIQTKTIISKNIDKNSSESGRGKSLTVSVFDISGKETGRIKLAENIFGVKVNKKLIAQAVRVYLANQRAGSAYAKSRGEVSYSTKKVWRQKGTGRARHGARSAPIFVKGGAAHGPKPYKFSLSMPKKMKKASLFSSLSLKAKEGNIKIVEGLGKIEPKTKIAAKMLAKMNLDNKKLLLVTGEKNSQNVKRAAGNIEKVSVLPAGNLNAYDVFVSKELVMMKEALEDLEKNFLGGEKK